MRIKVHGGTSRSDENLCTNCKFLHARMEDNIRQNLCNFNYYQLIPIRGKVVECNRYIHNNTPELHDMKKMAWILRTGASGHALGFVSNKDFRAKEGDSVLDDMHE